MNRPSFWSGPPPKKQRGSKMVGRFVHSFKLRHQWCLSTGPPLWCSGRGTYIGDLLPRISGFPPGWHETFLGSGVDTIHLPLDNWIGGGYNTNIIHTVSTFKGSTIEILSRFPSHLSELTGTVAMQSARSSMPALSKNFWGYFSSFHREMIVYQDFERISISGWIHVISCAENIIPRFASAKLLAVSVEFWSPRPRCSFGECVGSGHMYFNGKRVQGSENICKWKPKRSQKKLRWNGNSCLNQRNLILLQFKDMSKFKHHFKSNSTSCNK